MRSDTLVESTRTLLAALVLGVLVWYIARNEITAEEQAEIAVRVVNAENCRVEGENGQPVARVRALLTGPMLPLQRVRDAVQRQEVVAPIHLSPEQQATGGALTIPITESIFKPLPDSRVRLRVLDREVRLVVTPLTTRKLTVSLDVPDLDPARYRVRVLSPSEVVVSGPKGLLSRIQEVKTEPLRLAGIFDAGRRDFQATVEIAKVVEGQHIECDERVWVDIVFGEQIEHEFKDVPVHVSTPPDFPYEVRIVEPEQRTATVVVRGPQSVLLGNPQIAGQIDVYLKVDDPHIYKPRTTPYLIDRRCRLPGGVDLVSISGPDKVSVEIVERQPPPSGPS